MSNSSSDNSSGNYSDYDEQGTGTGIGTRTGEANASGSRTSETPTSTRSSKNESPDSANLCPPRALHEYAKGTFNSQKPLLLYASKVPGIAPPTNTKTKGGSRRWACNICGHPWVGSYNRVKQQ